MRDHTGAKREGGREGGRRERERREGSRQREDEVGSHSGVCPFWSLHTHHPYAQWPTESNMYVHNCAGGVNLSNVTGHLSKAGTHDQHTAVHLGNGPTPSHVIRPRGPTGDSSGKHPTHVPLSSPQPFPSPPLTFVSSFFLSVYALKAFCAVSSAGRRTLDCSSTNWRSGLHISSINIVCMLLRRGEEGRGGEGRRGGEEGRGGGEGRGEEGRGGHRHMIC